MRFIKSFFSILLVLVLIAVVVLYLLPGNIHIEKNMVLKAQHEVVYQHITEPHAWKDWAVWLKQDPSIEISYHGPEKEAGAAMDWNSQVPEVKTGNVLIQSAQPSFQAEAIVGFDLYGKSVNRFILENTGNGTRLTWTMNLNTLEKGFSAAWINKLKSISWKNKLDNWMTESLKNLDEVTANAVYYPPATEADSLRNRLDSLSMEIDSLKNNNQKKDSIAILP